jgi:GAF domain-containing protein
MLGYLQVGDKRDGSLFSPADLRLLAIIAGQAAPIIENAFLVQQSQRRARRAETLRRIASLTVSAATLDEILAYSVQDLARLLNADMAAIFLVDEPRGELRLHPGSIFGARADEAGRLGSIPMDAPEFRFTVTSARRPYFSGKVFDDPRVLPLYRPIVTALMVQSAIVVPLVVREHGIGEMMLGSLKVDFFSQGDAHSMTRPGRSQLSSRPSCIQTHETSAGGWSSCADPGEHPSIPGAERASQLHAPAYIARTITTKLKPDD